MLTKLDHIIYKQNGYISIETPTDRPQRQAIMVDNHNCRLGKWYYEGMGYQSFRHTSAYAKLNHPHADVHATTQRAYQISRGKWQEDQAMLNEIIHQMQLAENASADVMLMIDAMVEEKHNGS